MKMIIERVMILGFVAMLLMNIAMAETNHTVGDSNNGWNNTGINYQAWSSSQIFVVGDHLIFRYSTNHDVTEVSQADYASCSASNPLQPPQFGGLTVISLTVPGSRYFICATPGHCLNGMKIQVDIIAAASPPPTPITSPPPLTTPTPASSSPPPTSSTPPSSPTPITSPPPLATPTPASSSPPPTSSTPPSSPTPITSPPPLATPTPASSSSSPSPPPPRSAAIKDHVGAGLTAGFGLFMMVLFNL